MTSHTGTTLGPPTQPATQPATLRRRLLDAAVWSALVGGLILGTVLSVLHLRHNAVESPLVAVASWLWFGLLFGLLVSVPVLVAAVGWPVVRRFVRGDGPGRVGTSRAPLSSTVLGLRVFAAVYFGFGLLYGLTYDQTVLWHPEGAPGMTIYLAFAALLVVTICWWLTPRVLGVLGRGGAGHCAVVLAAAGIVVHGLVILLVEPPPTNPRRSATAVQVAPVRGGALATVDPADRERGTDRGESTPGETPGEIFPAPHVVLIGLDGLDPHVVRRFVEEGRLPTFGRILKEGVLAPLETLPDANSAVIWATVYSGFPRREHGILDFYRIRLPGLAEGLFPVHRTWFKEIVGVLGDLGLAQRNPVDRYDLRRFPLWEIVDRFGVSAGVVDGYLYSYPAVSLDSPESFLVAYGTDWLAAELDAGRLGVEELPQFVQPVDLVAPDQLPRSPDFQWQSELVLDLLADGRQPRFLNVYSHEPDALQHESWHGLEPRRYLTDPPPEDEGAIAEMHEAFDRFLAEITATAAPGTVFVLVSDHGHSATMVHRLDTQHRHGPEGVVMLWGEGVERGAQLERPHVTDVAPTVLALLGLPTAEAMPGRVWTEAFERSLRPLAQRSVPTYEGMWDHPERSSTRSEALNARELEKLEDMGYLN